ncbi:hypothetical protein ACS0TY_016236 [Phlomoides rotata]
MIFNAMWLFCTLSLPSFAAEFNTLSTNNAQQLNALLQNYAYQSFHRPRTGVVYDGSVPSNLAGIQVSAMRLRSGCLRKRGHSVFKEFEIPKGVVQHPYVERLVLVYHNLGNWSNTYYPLLNHTYLAPVLGLLAYDALNLTEKNLPQLHIRASDRPISIRFPELRAAPNGTVPKCVSFYSNGSVNFTDLYSDFTCATFEQGHFSIVVEPIAHPFPAINATKRRPIQIGKARDNSRVGVVVGSVVGGIAVLGVLGFVVVQMSRYNYRKRMDYMEKAAELGEALNMANVGGTKAPSATGTRTHPRLESAFMP